WFFGALDEVSIYSRALPAHEIWSIAAAGTMGKCPIGVNAPPSVDAGADLVVPDISSTAILEGTVSDDGLPGGGRVTWEWTKLHGSGDVEFEDATQLVTSVRFSTEGYYVLKLTA